MTAASLGHAMAKSGRRVLLIDCNRHGGTLHRLFRCEGHTGLAEILASADASVARHLHHDPHTGLDVLPAGAMTAAVFDRLTGAPMRTLLNDLAHRYDSILLDCPAVFASADTLALSRWADRIVYVVRWGHTTNEAVLHGLKQLAALDAPVVGIALTRVKVPRLRAYGFHHVRPRQRTAPIVASLLSLSYSARTATVSKVWLWWRWLACVCTSMSRSIPSEGLRKMARRMSA